MNHSKLATALLLVISHAAFADYPATVPVTATGNAADSTGFGAVGYPYRIGKFEVTNGEFAEFLNGVAKIDYHDLYDPRMAGEYGGIRRNGAAGSYTYSVKEGMGRKPVNFVTRASGLRFANWLTNGRSNGDTENGTYTFNAVGEITAPNHAALAAGSVTKWAMATENEWYKAAYFDPVKPGYWPYAVKGGSAPKCNINTNAPSDVGAFTMSPGPWGTFDQNGNMWEFNEATAGNKVGVRGGSFYLNDNETHLRAGTRYDVLDAKWPNYGFRIVALGGTGVIASVTPHAAPVPPSPTAFTPPLRAPIPVTPSPAVKRSGTPKMFYVSSSCGNDAATGESSSPNGGNGPWKTLARASTDYIPGDSILLKRGDTWHEELHPKGSGTAEHPVTIGAFGEGTRPVIDRQDFNKDSTGIRLADQEGYKIVGLEFARCMTGIYSEYSAASPPRKFIWIEDCYFHDSLLYQKYHDYPAHKIGLGICFFSHEVKNSIVLSDVTIRNCVFRRLASGIWTNSPDNFNQKAGGIYNFGNFNIEDCRFEEGLQWQLGMRGVDKGSVRRCVTHDIGRNFRSFNGVAGAMFARCKRWVFEDSEWGFISIGRKGAASGDGEAFDFESNCDDMVMRNCLFHDTDGPGFLLCCYASGPEPERNIVLENCVFNGKAKRTGENRMPKVEIINTTDLNEVSFKKCRFYLDRSVSLYATMDLTDPKKPLNNLKFTDCVIKNLAEACKTPPHGAIMRQQTGPLRNAATGETITRSIELDFGKLTTVNEFKIKEPDSSNISRYIIECWDDKQSRWIGCFNGLQIGTEFIAPIVPRTTTKARLNVLQTSGGEATVTSFEAFNDTSGEVYNDTTGGKPSTHSGK